MKDPDSLDVRLIASDLMAYFRTLENALVSGRPFDLCEYPGSVVPTETGR